MKVRIKMAEVLSKIGGPICYVDSEKFIEVEAEEIKEKPWFFNSRGQVYKTEHYKSDKHQQRVSFGNAFSSEKEAEEFVAKIHKTLTS